MLGQALNRIMEAIDKVKIFIRQWSTDHKQSNRVVYALRFTRFVVFLALAQ